MSLMEDQIDMTIYLGFTVIEVFVQINCFLFMNNASRKKLTGFLKYCTKLKKKLLLFLRFFLII